LGDCLDGKPKFSKERAEMGLQLLKAASMKERRAKKGSSPICRPYLLSESERSVEKLVNEENQKTVERMHKIFDYKTFTHLKKRQSTTQSRMSELESGLLHSADTCHNCVILQKNR
ncbi:hypothetical protein Bpfe_019239, partial [Biomphalaria pfeifferi]